MYIKRLLIIIKENITKFNHDDAAKATEMLSELNNSVGNIYVPYGNNEMRAINSNRIYYVREPKKGNVTIYTCNEEIPFRNTSFDLLEYLQEINPNFKYLNNGLVVNIPKMTNYCSDFNKVYFDNGKEVIVTGAAINNIVRKVLGKESDIAKNTLFGNFQLR